MSESPVFQRYPPHYILPNELCSNAICLLHCAAEGQLNLVISQFWNPHLFAFIICIVHQHGVKISIAHMTHNVGHETIRLYDLVHFQNAWGEVTDWHTDVSDECLQAWLSCQNSPVGCMSRLPQLIAPLHFLCKRIVSKNRLSKHIQHNLIRKSWFYNQASQGMIPQTYIYSVNRFKKIQLFLAG